MPMTSANPAEKPRVPETLLTRIWRGQWVQKGPLPASDGRMVRVRSTGIENRDSGPDFLGAKIVLDDELLIGDIELHVKSSDWHSHGHHIDPHFNKVILQVVLWDNASKPARLQNGNLIPTLSLYEHLNGSMDELSVRAETQTTSMLPCRDAGNRLNKNVLSTILTQSGDERFSLKSASFEVSMIIEEPAQVLYQGFMGALGYVKNKKAFQELARHMPLQVLESIAREQEPDARRLTLQALLLGAAGLLPFQYEQKSGNTQMGQPAELEASWRSLNAEPAMRHADWHFFRMHPRNFPTYRLLGAGWIIDRYLDDGLLNGTLKLVESAVAGKRVTSIERGFMIPDLIGQDRAREITVNVVLPFSLAWAEINSAPGLKMHIVELYRTYPTLGENQIIRYLSELLWGKKSRDTNSAQKQQGLIHLYKTFCQEQRCGVCPMNTGPH